MNSHQPVWHAYQRDDKGTLRVRHKKLWISRLTAERIQANSEESHGHVQEQRSISEATAEVAK